MNEEIPQRPIVKRSAMSKGCGHWAPIVPGDAKPAASAVPAAVQQSDAGQRAAADQAEE